MYELYIWSQDNKYTKYVLCESVKEAENRFSELVEDHQEVLYRQIIKF
jgi:hypothetical protein